MDNPRGNTKVSSLAFSRILLDKGFKPIMHLACGNRNRIAIGSDLLGAAALGIENVLFVTGDHPITGKNFGAKPVFDIDSVHAITFARDKVPELFPGAVVNPFGYPLELQIARMKQKIESGAKFFFTQPIFDMGGFEDFMDRVYGLKVPVIPGILPIGTSRSYKFIKEKIPGIYIPEEFDEKINSLKDTGDFSIGFSRDILKGIRKIKGVSGVNIMASSWWEALPEIFD